MSAVLLTAAIWFAKASIGATIVILALGYRRETVRRKQRDKARQAWRQNPTFLVPDGVRVLIAAEAIVEAEARRAGVDQ